jgi:hypothetical protein
MPRLPVDGKKVQEIRVTMGDKERMLAEDLISSIRINQISTPIVDLLKDVTGTATVALLIGYVFPNFLINNATGLEYTRDQVMGKDEKGLIDYVETQNLAAIAAVGALAFFTGGLGLGAAALVGILGGTVAAEGAEEVVKDVQGAKNAAVKQARILRLYFTLTESNRSLT